MKKAIVLGSTGMVGSQLVDLLISTSEYAEIITFVRRPSGKIHPKLKEYVVNFDDIQSWSQYIQDNVLFSCMGTTLAQAKSKENQFKIDYTYQYNVAEIASKNEVNTYVLVSSAGANAKSSTFYMQMKGKLDEAVKSLAFKNLIILRPGQLYGDRNEKRMGEKIGLSVMFFLNKIGILSKYKPIHAMEVAKAMLAAVNKQKSATYTLDELFELI